MDDNRIISPNLKGNNEENLENSLRPQVLDDYIGPVSYTHLDVYKRQIYR